MFAAIWVGLAGLSTAYSQPLEVGFRDVSFDDSVAGLVDARVYYPSERTAEGAPVDVSKGPYPVSVFLHGYTGQAWMYNDICSAVAEQGFVVISLNTETGEMDTDAFADDGKAALHWVDSQSNDPSSWLAEMASEDVWSALGHSMGGATLAKLVSIEPRVRALVGLMPYQGFGPYYDYMSSFDGSALYVTATNDETAVPSMVDRWFNHFDSVERGLFYNIEGGGHYAALDFNLGQQPLAHATQKSAVSEMSVHFLLAEVLGQEEHYESLTTPVDVPLAAQRATGHRPALWARMDGDVVTLGMVGARTAEASVYRGTALAAESDVLTEDLVLVDPKVLTTFALDNGFAEIEVEAASSPDESLWIQGALDDGGITRPIQLVEGALVEGDPARGCSHAPLGLAGWGFVLALGLARRREQG